MWCAKKNFSLYFSYSARLMNCITAGKIEREESWIMPKDISVIRKIIAEIRNPSVNIYENRALNNNKAADTSGKTPKKHNFFEKEWKSEKVFPELYNRAADDAGKNQKKSQFFWKRVKKTEIFPVFNNRASGRRSHSQKEKVLLTAAWNKIRRMNMRCQR